MLWCYYTGVILGEGFMRAFRVNRALASTALALVLAAPGIALASSASAEEAAASVAQALRAATAAVAESAQAAKETTEPASAAESAAPTQEATALPPAAAENAEPAKQAAAPSEAEIEARIPVPESADLPPPSLADIGGPATGSVAAPPAATASIETRVPVPQPADVAPPATKDVMPPAAPTAAAPAAAKGEPPAAVATPAAGQAPAAATPGAQEPAPIATTLAAADIPIAEKMRDILLGKVDKLFDRKKERTAVEAFYPGRGFAPLWIDNGALSARGKAVIERLKAADLDGLDPRDYPTPDFAALAGNPDALAEAELKLTATVLTFARHASSGRFNALRLTSNLDVPQPALDPSEVLASIAGSKDVAKTLDTFDPPQEGFQLLKAKLAEILRHGSTDDGKRIAEGPTLKVGMQDARVPSVRDRLGVEGDAANLVYDAKLAEAVKKFQRSMEMRATGLLDAHTVAALNGPPPGHRVDAIIATMERWRWMPRDLGKAYVIINLPDFTLKMMQGDKVLFRTRIVIGKPSMPTPLFSNAIENIIVNPTWHVPDSIVNHEYLPALAQDPTVLARMGLIVEHDRSGRVVISQPPGAGNALGRMKFNFPNKFNVYLHDTPDKNLFGLARRAFSHGCMRVQNPPAFGEALLSVALPEGHYTSERLQRMFGRGEETLNFKTPIPVHITYQTAFVDESGRLELRDDIYGLDSRVLAAAKNADLRIADDGPAEGHRAHAPAKRRLARQVPRPVAETGGGFFDRLFR